MTGKPKNYSYQIGEINGEAYNVTAFDDMFEPIQPPALDHNEEKNIGI
jgi:hypothetical protein